MTHYRLLTVREVDRRAVWPKISIHIADPSMLVDEKAVSTNHIVCIDRDQETWKTNENRQQPVLETIVYSK